MSLRTRRWLIGAVVALVALIALVAVVAFIGSDTRAEHGGPVVERLDREQRSASHGARADEIVSATAPTAPTASNTTRPSVTSTSPQPSVAGATNSEELPGGIAKLAIAGAHFEGYDRDLFGDWTDADHDCQNTRAEALIAESQIPVAFTSARSCAVATGQWVDPWSGTVNSSASALDVDHTVPLANAWRSGAWAWTPEQRIAYANDLADPDHLIGIPLGENHSKGDDGPEGWRPPTASAWCAYARMWTAIKARWNLTATPAEWSAILEMASTC